MEFQKYNVKEKKKEKKERKRKKKNKVTKIIKKIYIPIIQSEVSQKEKHQYNILMHIYGI